jgi:hypothetical protein
MPNVYIEARPKGRPEGTAIEGHQPLVARIRHRNNKSIPDHWRKA